MKTASVSRTFHCVAAGVLVLLVLLGTTRIAFGNAIRDRLLGDRFKPVSPEEVSAVVEKHPNDAQLLYAASDYFLGTEKREALLARAIELDNKYETVALAQEIRSKIAHFAGTFDEEGVFNQYGPEQISRNISRISELLSHQIALEPENAFPRQFLAHFAFLRNDVEEGFALIDEVLKKPRFETYEVDHLRARFRLLETLGRDGVVKFSTLAASPMPELGHARHLAKKLIDRGDQKLAAGDRRGALADYAAADGLANQLLLARPRFGMRELMPISIKHMVLQARLKLYEAEGDAVSVAGIRLQLHALEDHGRQISSALSEGPVQRAIDDLFFVPWPDWSEETLDQELSSSREFAVVFERAATQLQHFAALPDLKEMMTIIVATFLDDSELAAYEKAADFYQRCSLPESLKTLEEAIGSLGQAVRGLPGSKHTACRDNLKQLGLAIAMYAAEHEGLLPDAIQGLVRYTEHRGVLSCPESGSQYQYVGKGLNRKTATNPSRIIVAYDPTPVHRGGRHVLCLDCHVEWLAEEGFQHRLGQQQEEKAAEQSPKRK